MSITFRGITRACNDNPHLDRAVRTLDGFATAISVQQQATERLKGLVSTKATVEFEPMLSGDITDKWLNTAVRDRVQARDTDIRIELLENLRIAAESDAANIVELGADTILAALDTELQTLVANASDAAQLLSGATTATEAISRGAHAAWADLTKHAEQYADLRIAQRHIITSMSPDLVIASQTQHQPDAHASDLFIGNLDELWPNWRRPETYGHAGYSGDNGYGNTTPWPNEPVEQLVWMVTHDAQLWIPTMAKLEQLHTSRRAVPVRSEGVTVPAAEQGQTKRRIDAAIELAHQYAD
ncbi:hypothetical protein [Gordonia sp. 4N]|uniref:hypothetical protein n=1 Tax=Gordonia sp. 4N TaxID=2993508 RepID=UPI0022496E70|nr:hypothetical protein [Gordonia sp. 4N]MCX2755511.1 hypothetical protein [Gordonia sp. 4N]